MITEDYVSFETAKLLKEKGFDAECHSHYYPCHYPDGSIKYHRDKGAQSGTKTWYDVYSLKNLPRDHYLAPTLQMTMKWLREVHDVIVNVFYDKDEEKWCAEHYRMLIDDYTLIGYHNTYEEACEAGIKYCLEGLI